MEPIRKSIATVSVSGRLVEKLTAIAQAGFDGVEIFDQDLVACPLSPARVAELCADLGLGVDLFQPIRDAEGVPPERFDRVLHRVRRKLEIAAELGAPTILICSNVQPDALDHPGVRAEQLHRLGDLAATFGITIAYEALAWGGHVNRVGQAWDAVARADHPGVRLAVDTFHLLARGDDAAALGGIPGDRIGFLQVADAPRLEMNLLEWSRHFRCFPGQGTLDVAGVVRATLEAGYRGPVSLEVFSDVVREVPAGLIARDAMRSLRFLEDQLTQTLPKATSDQFAFVEVASPDDDHKFEDFLTGLGFRAAAEHRSKPVTWWRNGGASIVINSRLPTGPADPDALGLLTGSVPNAQRRAEALAWPSVVRTRGDDEAALPGIAAPSGVHVFFSGHPGSDDDWRTDFASEADGAGRGSEDQSTWAEVDHVGISVDPDRLNEEVSFFRTLLSLQPGSMEEFMQPRGRLRSLALQPAMGGLRIVLNVSEVAGGVPRRHGITQLAFRCRDIFAEVGRIRDRGVDLMAVPDNYYADLDARFDLAPTLLERLQEFGLLYDADETGGELLHAYTPMISPGYYLELLERRGGYAGYGAANTYIRLVAQHS